MLGETILNNAIVFQRSIYDEHKERIFGGDDLDKNAHLPRKIEFYDEEVVFLGFFRAHHGHFITEELGTLWWVLQNGVKNRKFIYTRYNSPELSPFERFILELFALQNNVFCITKASQFRQIIVIDNSFHHKNGTLWHRKTIDFITSKIKPVKNEALYLSRRNFAKAKSLEFGEEYFESQYAKKGYKIIYPEMLSPQEQISLWGGGIALCSNRRNFAT